MRRRTEEELLAELCRYAEAARPRNPSPSSAPGGGFDGGEHPEYTGMVRTILGQLGMDMARATGFMNGDLVLSRKVG